MSGRVSPGAYFDPALDVIKILQTEAHQNTAMRQLRENLLRAATFEVKRRRDDCQTVPIFHILTLGLAWAGCVQAWNLLRSRSGRGMSDRFVCAADAIESRQLRRRAFFVVDASSAV